MSDDAPLASSLSNREQEVAGAYAAGQSYKEIARALGLSPTTVRSHLRTVYGKLGVTSKIALARVLDHNSAPEEDSDHSAIVADLALELDEAIRRERSLAKVLRIISDQTGERDAVIDAVLDHALEICEAEFGILFEYQGELRFRELRSRNISPAFAQWLEAQQVFSVEEGTGLGRVATQMQTVNIADVRGEDVYESGAALRIATADLGKARSFAAIPMVSGDRLIGVFTVYRTRVHPFNDRSLELAQLFADQAVIAIENVRRFHELKNRLDRESVTREILQTISQSRRDEQPVFESILANARRLCDAPFAALILGRKGDTHQIMAAHHGAVESTVDLYGDGHIPMDPKRSFAARAILERRIVHLPNMQDTDEYRAGIEGVRKLCDIQGIRTNLFVPLIADGEGIGCFIIFRHEVRPYNEDQIALVETFAAQAVIAIENVRQFRELEARLERQDATRRILQVISESRDDEQPVFDAILENACRLCEAQMGAFVMGREVGDQVVMVAHRGATEATQRLYRDGHYTMQPGGSLSAEAILERKIIHIEDMAQTERYLGGTREHGRWSKNRVFAPIFSFP